MTRRPYRASVVIGAAPNAVFPYLVDSRQILRWMGDRAVLDPRPGGEFTLDINGVPVRGRFLEVDPPNRLVVSWGHEGSSILPPGASRVEITLTPVPEGTRVTVAHHDLPPEEFDKHSVGWPHFLGRLARAAAGMDPGPDPFAIGRA